MGTISTTRTRLLNLAKLQVTRTASQVNVWWPPVPPEA
jgi:hypothetical protein